MGIDSLPDELLADIFLCTHRISDPKTFQHISTVSRRFNRISEPIFYSNFHQRGTHALSALLTTLLEKPHLASHIKHVTVTTPAPHFGDVLLSGSSKRKEHWIREQYPKDESDEIWKVWMKELHPRWLRRRRSEESKLRGNYDAALALLLLICADSIASLHVKDYGRQAFEHRWTVDLITRMSKLQKQSITVSSMSNLRKVTIEHFDHYGHSPDRQWELDYCADGGSQFFPFLAMNSVEEVEAHQVVLDHISDIDMWRRSISLRKLRLIGSHLGPTTMKIFLSLFRCLKQFDFQDGFPQPWWEISYPPAIGEGLSHLKDCLEEVNFESLAPRRGIYRKDPSLPYFLPPIQNPEEFKMLKKYQWVHHLEKDGWINHDLKSIFR